MYERRRKVMETDTIIHNDCLDALKDMPSESATAVSHRRLITGCVITAWTGRSAGKQRRNSI